MFAIFGGWFGLHQYYVGKIITGLIYTFTCGLFFFGWIIDIFRIVIGSFRDNTGAPLRK
jgi:restriction system protein